MEIQLKFTGQEIFDALAHAALCEKALGAYEDYWNFEYHPDWSIGVEMACYKSGSGDDLFIIKTHGGYAIKGFDHESPSSPYARPGRSNILGMYDGMPEDLIREIQDPAFSHENVTFALWQLSAGNQWQRGVVGPKDGLDWMLDAIPFTSAEFIQRTEEVLERKLSEEEKYKISAIYEDAPNK